MIKMEMGKSKVVLYVAGLLICIAIWLALKAGELSTFHILNFLMLIIFSYVAMITDINTKRIPNMLVSIMIFVWMLLIMSVLFVDAKSGVRLLMDSAIGFLLGGGVFLSVYLISRKGLGGGDVKFMAAAGLYLGFAEVLPAILYGTVLAAIVGLILILLKKIERKGKMPLAPFLFVGIMMTLLI